MNPSVEPFRSLPRAELHLHLDGAVRPETILDLAATQGVELPVNDAAALARLLHPHPGRRSLPEYLRAFELTTAVMQQADALRRIAREVVEDAARDGLRYVELRYAPILMTVRGMAMEHVVEAVAAGIRDAAGTGTIARQILCAMRQRDDGHAVQTAALAASSRDIGVVGFDLAGPEAGYPPSLHARALAIAREAGLGITLHAGEAAGPESVADALDHGATRIGHGTRMGTDPTLLARILEGDITVEACLTSNVQTGAIDHLAAHPLAAWLDAGVRVTICTDNTEVSAVSHSGELALAASTFSLSRDALRRIVANGFDAAFLDRADRARLRDEALAAFDTVLP